MCLTKCELFFFLLKGRGVREAKHLASLTVVLTMVLNYTPHLRQTGSWLGVVLMKRSWWGFLISPWRGKGWDSGKGAKGSISFVGKDNSAQALRELGPPTVNLGTKISGRVRM